MHHGLLSQSQQGWQPLSGRLPHRLTYDSGALQHVPDAVFQELQRQREGKDEAQDGGRGTSRETNRGRAGRTSATGKAPLAFSAQNGSNAPSSPPTPLDGDATGSSRLSRPEVPRGRSRRHSLSPNVTQAPLAIQVRPDVGSRTTTAPSWPRSPEAVSSQFLGGHLETDADFLTRETTRQYGPPSNSRVLPTPASETYLSLR